MNKDNRTTLMNQLNTLLEMSYDSFLMDYIKKTLPFLAKAIDVSIQCVEEIINHIETPNENAEKVISSHSTLINSVQSIRSSIRHLYPDEPVVSTMNWKGLASCPVTVH